MTRSADEAGFTLVETMIASIVALVVLTMISFSVITLTQTSVGAIQRGSSTGPALLVAQEIQQVLSGAVDPTSARAGVTFDCSFGSSGQEWPQSAGQGPFVSASSNDIMFCGLRNGSSTAYTFELHFVGNCASTSTCTLELDQEPAPSCSPCNAQEVYSATGVSSSGAPFSFYTESGSSWTSLTPACTLDPICNYGDIEAVEATLQVQPSSTRASTIQRMILLPYRLETNGNT